MKKKNAIVLKKKAQKHQKKVQKAQLLKSGYSERLIVLLTANRLAEAVSEI
jgi:hypothetical protein